MGMDWNYILAALTIIEIIGLASMLYWIKNEVQKTIEDESDDLNSQLAAVLQPIIERIDGFLGGNSEIAQPLNPMQSMLMEIVKSSMNKQPIQAKITEVVKDSAGKFTKTEILED